MDADVLDNENGAEIAPEGGADTARADKKGAEVFRERLIEVRTKAGLSQSGLAERLGIERQRIGKWENGASLPSIYQLASLAAALDVTTDYLLGLEEPPEVVTMSLNERAKAILDKAREKGIEHALMFETTFKRYIECTAHLDALHKAIVEHGPVVAKTYVKGRENLTSNPAIKDYNSTAQVANDIEKLLMKFIIEPLTDGDDGDEFDAFLRR